MGDNLWETYNNRGVIGRKMVLASGLIRLLKLLLITRRLKQPKKLLLIPLLKLKDLLYHTFWTRAKGWLALILASYRVIYLLIFILQQWLVKYLSNRIIAESGLSSRKLKKYKKQSFTTNPLAIENQNKRINRFQ